MTYATEGAVAAYLHLPDLRSFVLEAFRPAADSLLSSQNEDGSWGAAGSQDQQRSPRVATLLTLYAVADPARESTVGWVSNFAKSFKTGWSGLRTKRTFLRRSRRARRRTPRRSGSSWGSSRRPWRRRVHTASSTSSTRAASSGWRSSTCWTLG